MTNIFINNKYIYIEIYVKNLPTQSVISLLGLKLYARDIHTSEIE